MATHKKKTKKLIPLKAFKALSANQRDAVTAMARGQTTRSLLNMYAEAGHRHPLAAAARAALRHGLGKR